MDGNKLTKSKPEKNYYWWEAFVTTWHHYLSTTTIPGLQNVHNASGRWACTVWTLLFLLGFVCTVRDVYTTTAEYLAYPVITSMTMDQAASLSFPSVTVCNMNRVHCSHLRNLTAQHFGSELGTHLLKLHKLTNCQLDFSWDSRRKDDEEAAVAQTANPTASSRSTRGAPASSAFTKVDPETEVGTTAAPRAKRNVTQTKSFNDLMHFLVLYTNLSNDVRKEIGHQFEEFVRSCTFSGKSCLNEDMYFTHIINSAYGNCFTFTTDRKTVIPGKDYGLSMELYLDQKNYLGAGLSPQAGARVVVHSRGHLPLPEENGITVPPHVATSIALLEVRIKRLKLPYVNNCTSSWNSTWYHAQVKNLFPYSSERCQRVCLQLAFEEKCNCSHPTYMDLTTGFGPCNLTSESPAFGCALEVLEEFENQNRTCSCNMDCREVTYETRISTALWPTDNYWCSVASRYSLVEGCRAADDEYGGEMHHQDKDRVQNNLLKIDIYFENLRVKSTEQNPTYKPQTYVGSLGGALSLYLGITLLMLVEALEMMFRLIFSVIWYYYQKISAQVKKTSSKKPEFLHKPKQSGKIETKLPQPVIFTGRFTPPHHPLLRPRYAW